MNQKLRTRLIVVVLVAVLGTIATLAAGWRPSLGLDLQGGTSVVLEPKGDVKADVLDRTIGIIRSRVDALGVAEPDISRQGSRSIVVSLPGVKDSSRALAIVGKTAQLTFRPVLGDLQPEATAAAAAKTTKKTAKTVTVGATTTVAPGSATTTAATTVAPTTVAPSSAEQALGASSGAGRFSVLTQTETTTATTAAPTTTAPTTTAAPTTTVAGGATTTVAAGATTTVPVNPSATVAPAADTNAPGVLEGKTTALGEDDPLLTVILPDKRNDPTSPRYLLGPAEVKGAVVDTADAVIDPGTQQWTVDLKLNGSGATLWDAMAEKYYGQRIAIVLDGEVVSAPSINARRFGGRATISGNFDSAGAKDLATALKFGSLPVTLEPQTVQNVSASLGKDSLHAGLIAGGIGLLLVAAYMVFYYRALGLVVVAGLLTSGGLMWTLVSFLSEKQGLALSLSGVVGIVVSFGTTVDSYVVFFERMRDELRAGRNVAQSVERGFKSAFRTIIAADFTSLIGAGVLYFLTVGSVRGFALFLIISTTLDIIVAWSFTRPLVTLIAERQMKKQGLAPGSGGGDAPTRIKPTAGRLTPGAANNGAVL